MKTILHVITTLDGGGAEASLHRLVAADRSNDHHVVSLRAGSAREKLGHSNTHTLDMPAGRVTVRGLRQLRGLLRTIEPDVVQTWMYHADLVGGIMARLAGVPVCWGIRNAYLDKDTTSASTRAVVRACAALSHALPAKIVACSRASARMHVERGYARVKMCVIPNGYDAAQLHARRDSRDAIRASWSVSPDTFVLGFVARWDAQKDHANLIAALGLLSQQLTMPWACVLIGQNVDERNPSLVRLIDAAGVRPNVRMPGPTGDVAGVMAALDLHVLPSRGEAFPNVVAEAMACETPCVVTDVGDAALIVGDTGWIVPPRDPAALAAAIRAAAGELRDPGQRTARGATARARILRKFGIARTVAAYDSLWAQVTAPAMQIATSRTT